MRIYQCLPTLLLSISFSISGFSNSPPLILGQVEQLQVPQCLANQIPKNYPILAENKQFKVIEVPTKEVDSMARLADKIHCGRFLNVTKQVSHGRAPFSLRQSMAAFLLKESSSKPRPMETSYPITHQSLVTEALKSIKPGNIIDNIHHLSSNFYNRSALEQDGVEAEYSIREAFEELAENSERDDVELHLVPSGIPYRQKSIVAVLGKDINAPAVILGAHMDTLDGQMPGADDDASGSATVLEIARVLLESNPPLKNPVYFIWYAAEERGLVGSQRVVEYFINRKIPVKAVLQFDMTGYQAPVQDPRKMWLYTDNTNPGLTRFLQNLIEAYIGVPTGKSSCGYACSDHASWTAKGFPAAFPAESDFHEINPNIHGALDTVDILSPEHLANFAKLGLAFVIELAV